MPTKDNPFMKASKRAMAAFVRSQRGPRLGINEIDGTIKLPKKKKPAKKKKK